MVKTKTKETTYICEVCNKGYLNMQSARRCENQGIKNSKLSGAVFTGATEYGEQIFLVVDSEHGGIDKKTHQQNYWVNAFTSSGRVWNRGDYDDIFIKGGEIDINGATSLKKIVRKMKRLDNEEMKRLPEHIKGYIAEFRHQKDFKTKINIEKGIYQLPEYDFFILPREEILKNTTEKYRKFLKDVGYMDLDNASSLMIAKDYLKINDYIAKAARKNKINLKDKKYYLEVSQKEGRKIAQDLGYRLLTTKLMLSLFVPYLEKLKSKRHEEAKLTLSDMHFCNELLEDRLLFRGNKKYNVRIGQKEVSINLPTNLFEGYTPPKNFNKENLDDFGYPHMLHHNGYYEFYFSDTFYFLHKQQPGLPATYGREKLYLSPGDEPTRMRLAKPI